jgi:hypothetical protein
MGAEPAQLNPSGILLTLVVGGIGLALDKGFTDKLRPTFAAGTAGLAIAWGVRDRLDDRRVGGDREAAAQERRGVFDGIRSRARTRLWLRGVDLEREIPIGISARGEVAVVNRGTCESGSHVLIPGASGAGKTTSLAAILAEYVLRSRFQRSRCRRTPFSSPSM